MEKDTKRLNIKISEDLHAKLKAASALDRTTIQDYVEEAIKEKLNKEKEESDE